MSSAVPGITIIVPTYNNARTVAATLQSVCNQDYPLVELIVVDNHSTDSTAKIAAQFADRVLTAGPERSAQRNLGVRSAIHPWVMWLDSDMILPPQTLSIAMDTALATGADGIALPERTIGEGFWTACRALERECYVDQPLLHNPRILRKEFMTTAGSFHEDMSGPEDADLRLKMRNTHHEIVLAPVLIDHDEGHLTLREIMNKRLYYGKSIPQLQSQHEGALRSQWKLLSAAYWRHRGDLLRKPVLAAGMVFMRAWEASGYVVGAWQGRRQ